MRPGDLILIFFIWYAAVRLLLETLRTGNWTFFGVPTAMLISASVIVLALAILAFRHRPAAAGAERWGDPPAQGGDDEEQPHDDEEQPHDDNEQPHADREADAGDGDADTAAAGNPEDGHGVDQGAGPGDALAGSTGDPGTADAPGSGSGDVRA